MQHPFQELRSEYAALLSTMIITRASAVDNAILNSNRGIFKYVDRYLAVQRKSGVPAALIAGLNLRESDQDFSTGLGQGDPWSRVSVHVPRGEGPFQSWEDAALFYVHYDHLDDISSPWDMTYLCWKGEIWNGFGPRAHGIHTGYLWAGTNHYTRGKYVADGEWNPNHVDEQLGIVPVIARMIQLRPELAIGNPIVFRPGVEAPPIPKPTPVALSDVTTLQRGLNRLLNLDPPLVVDNNYGRRTREAVREFQEMWVLEMDGLAGPKTYAAFDRAIMGESPRPPIGGAAQ